MAPEGWTAPVAFAANDDVGVARVGIKYRVETPEFKTPEFKTPEFKTPELSLEKFSTQKSAVSKNYNTPNHDAMIEVTPPLQRRGATYASARHDLCLNDLGAAAGDTVIGFATAFDNHPAPAQSADSASFRIAVITQREYEELARRQYTIDQINDEVAAFDEAERELNARREAAIEELAELQKEMRENGGELSEEGQQKLDEIRRELESQRSAAQELAEAMRERAEQPALYEFEEALSEQLNESAERLERQAAENPSKSGEQGAGDENDPGKEIDEMLKKLRKDQNEADEARSKSEMTAEQMQQLEMANRVMMHADWLMDITRRQRQVADHMAEYGEQNVLMFDGQARLDRLADEQAALADELRQALDELGEAAAEAESLLPKMSSTAVEFVEKVEGLEVHEDQTSAATAARAMFGLMASHHAERAASSLESLIGECRSMGGEASSSIDGAFGMSMGQMGAMMSQLGQSRPGSGSKNGSGQGSGGGNSASMSSSNPNGPGGQMVLAGPHFDSPQAQARRVSKHTGAYGRAGGPGADTPGASAPESLEPDSESLRNAGPGASFGVPARYRRLSVEYFRRLARDPVQTSPSREAQP
jgi:hypothetical protein